MVTFADTSFLFSLYGNDVHTSRAVSMMKRRKAPLMLTVLSEYELANALRFAEFRKGIAAGEAALFLAQFEADRACGRIQFRICNLADVIEGAKRLSATHTIQGGHGGFDILHVATALHLGVTEFLTFDANQKKLAEAEGLKVPI
jgi:predicted nucleic acid-binding protein